MPKKRFVSSSPLSKFLPGMLLLIFSSIGSYTPAQNVTFNDVFGFGSPLDDQATRVEYASNGDFYVTGFFSGTIDLDPGPGTYTFTTNTGGPDNYLAKFRSDGTLDWAWRQTAYDNDDRIWDIEIDKNGDVIIVGAFRQTVDFDPGGGAFNLTANGGSGGGTDIFVAKYSSGGSLLFAKRVGGYLDDSPYKVVVDEFNNIFLSGFFKDTVDFDPGVGSLILSAVGGEEAFFMKLDGFGELVWAKQIGGQGNQFASFISVGKQGQILVGGIFSQTIDLDPGVQSHLINSAGFWDCFFAMYDPEGHFIWGKTIGSPDYESLRQGFIDQEGGCLITGRLDGSLDLDPGPGIEEFTTQTTSSSFIARYRSDGSFDYAFLLSDQQFVIINDLIEDKLGSFFATGTFLNTVDLDPGPGTAALTAIDEDVFFAKYDLKGNFRWAYGIRGDGRDYAGDLDISPSGEVILVGSTERRTDFNIGTGTDTLPWNGNLSAFVARYNQCLAVYPDSQSICPDQTYMLGNQILTGPGDYVQTVSLPGGCDSIVRLNLSTISVDTGISLQGYDLVSSASGATYQWINCVSNQVIIGADSGTFTPSVPGDYAVVVSENGCSDTSACMTITTVGSTELIEQGLIRMYPNPVEDVLHLDFPSPVKLSAIQLFDLTGRMLVSEQMQGASASWSLALREVPAGMYLVAVAYADGSRQVGRIWVK